MAIYHDRFIDLQKELRQTLMSEQVPGQPPAAEQRPEQKPGPPALRESVLRYLRRHRAHLPMFAPTDIYRLPPTAAGRQGPKSGRAGHSGSSGSPTPAQGPS